MVIRQATWRSAMAGLVLVTACNDQDIVAPDPALQANQVADDIPEAVGQCPMSNAQCPSSPLDFEHWTFLHHSAPLGEKGRAI